MSGPGDRGGDPRFDLSLRAAIELALLPHAAALDAAADPSLDAGLYEHESHHEGCDCAACVAYVAEIDVIAGELRAQAIAHREDRAACGLDESDALHDGPCPLALMARGGGVAEGRGRYAPAPRASRPRFVPSAPVRRAGVC